MGVAPVMLCVMTSTLPQGPGRGKGRRLRHADIRPVGQPIRISFDGEEIAALAGETVAAALSAAGILAYRSTAGGALRGLYCGMGACFDCLVTLDGRANQRACLAKVRDGLVVSSAPPDHPAALAAAPAAIAERDCDVLVVGAGPAGTRAAMRAAALMPTTAVTLVGAEAALPYDRVALSKLLAGDIEVPALLTHSAIGLRRGGVAYRPATRIANIDRVAKQVVTAAGEALPYDHLMLALGSQAVRLPLPGADLPGVIGYRDLADVRAMLRAAEGRGQAVVIGGGLLGLEAAAGLTARGMKVTVVHAVGWPMERQLDARAGAMLAARMGGRGIRFAMPASTVALEGEGHVQGVRLSDGRLLPARLVVMAVGIRPNVALAREAGLAVGRGIQVDAAMFSSDPAIQAIGECAEVAGQCVGLVAPALDQAEAAAAALAGAGQGWSARADSAALKVSGTAVWSAGDIAAADVEVMTLHDESEDCYRRLVLRQDRLVGALLYGDTADSGFYLDLITRGVQLGAARAALAFGPQFMEQAA